MGGIHTASLGTTLLAELEHNGCRGTIIPIHYLHNLQQEMAELNQSGYLNSNFIQKYLNRFQYDYFTTLPHAQSIIVAAVPQPITVLRLLWRGKKYEVMVPPTYVYTEAEKLVSRIVENELEKENFTWVHAELPLKLLAVRSGLSRYGRNNISYIAGMGSFYRLTALISDMPSDLNTWQDIQRMPDCNNCHACLHNCPTRCIDANRTMIQATRCLTYINEAFAPFPAWVEDNWHNAWIGCMRCQSTCPKNRGYNLIRNYAKELTESEINELLNETGFAGLAEPIRDTLEQLNLTDYELAILQRNLRALLLR